MNIYSFRFLILTLISFISVLTTYSQNSEDLRKEQLNKIQNLEKEVNLKKKDTLLVYQTSELSRLYSTIGLHNKSLELAKQSLEISKELDYSKGEASAYASIGSIYFDIERYEQSIRFLLLALDKCKENKQEVEMTFIYRFLGESFLAVEDTVKAINFHNEGLVLSKKLNIPNRVVFAHDFLGHIYFHQKEYYKAIDHFKKSLSISQELRNNNRVALSAGNIGLSYIELNEKRKSIQFLILAMEYYKIDNNIKGVVWMNSLISDIYKEIGEFSKALEYNNENFVIHTNNRNSIDLAGTYRQKGRILMESNMFSEAEESLQEAYKIFEDEYFLTGQARVLTDFGNLYYLIGEYNKALEYLKNAKKTAEITTNKNITPFADVLTGAVLIKLGETLKGVEVLENSLTFYKATKSTRYLPFIYKNLAQADSILGNFESSLNNYKRFIHHSNLENNDKFFAEKTAYQYEFEKKEAIAKAELETRNTQRNAAIGGLILLSIIIVIFIYFFRLRNKKLKIERENIDLQKREILRIKEVEHFKSRFLTNITHEFRTPLTLIKGYLEVIKEKNEDLEHLKEMEDNSNRMLQLINQLMGLSKMESGSYELKYSKGGLLETAETAVQDFEALAKLNDINFVYTVADFTTSNFDSNLFVYSKEVVATVLSNLLSNAFKFTPKGGEIKVVLCALDSKILTIKVSDTGVGIPSDEVGNVFERYHQVDTPTQRTYEGSGIGLAIVKEMVLLHGGSVFVESEGEKGSTFTVHLKSSKETIDDPSEVSDLKSFNTPPSVVLQENKNTDTVNDEAPIILVVEDKKELRRFIVNNLEGKYQFVEASNGREGVELAEKFLPDLIISDIMMPDMDGLELCKQLKSQDSTSHIPIMLLTAKSDHADVLIGLEHGADDYLVKPFSLIEIRLRVGNILRTRELFRNKFNQSKVLSLEDKTTKFNQREREFIEKLELIIINNISNQLFGVPELAQEMFLSPSQLTRKLKGLINKTPGVYIKNMRFEKAKQLLLDGYNVSEAAWKVGFDDPVYFSKVFKKHFGEAPSFIKNRSETSL